MLRPTRAEVDLSAIRDNIRAIRARVGPRVRIMPAVKADGYGHGSVQASQACVSAGADVLCVASLEEGIELRDAGVSAPVLILGCSVPCAAYSILAHDIASTVCDFTFARALSDAAVQYGKKASVHVKVDTGMGRIGVPAELALEFVGQVAALPGLEIDGIFTHFPSSDEEDRTFTLSQVTAFGKIIDGLKRQDLRVPVAHASNSGGILGFPEANFDAVRPGIIAYGLYPSMDTPQSIPVREALTLKTGIVFIKSADEGATISYGRTHALKRRSRVATIPIGYADGYPRSLSNIGEAAVRGIRVPIIGRVCMDQCLIDVTDVPGVGPGDEVVLYGGGYDYLSILSVSEKLGTIPHDLLCAISKRVPREYVS